MQHIRGSRPIAHPARAQVWPRVSEATQTRQTRAQLGVVEFWEILYSRVGWSQAVSVLTIELVFLETPTHFWGLAMSVG